MRKLGFPPGFKFHLIISFAKVEHHGFKLNETVLLNVQKSAMVTSSSHGVKYDSATVTLNGWIRAS